MPNNNWIFLTGLFSGNKPGSVSGSLQAKDLPNLIAALQYAQAKGMTVMFSVSRNQKGGKAAANLSVGILPPRNPIQNVQGNQSAAPWATGPTPAPAAPPAAAAPWATGGAGEPADSARPDNDDEVPF